MSNVPISRPDHHFLVAEDWSSWGSMSLQVATTVLQNLGIPSVSLPVNLLATHPGHDVQAPKLDVSQWLQQVLTYWDQVAFSGLALGYLGTKQLVTIWQKYLANHHLPLVVIDPAMADNGRLYGLLNHDYVKAQRQLLPFADVLTPNFTEAQLLLDTTITTSNQLGQALKQLTQQIKGNKVVITGVANQDKVGCVYLMAGKLQYLAYPKAQHSVSGSGDLFTSILAGCLLQQMDWLQAVQTATRLTTKAVTLTPTKQSDVQVATIAADLEQLRMRK